MQFIQNQRNPFWPIIWRPNKARYHSEKTLMYGSEGTCTLLLYKLTAILQSWQVADILGTDPICGFFPLPSSILVSWSFPLENPRSRESSLFSKVGFKTLVVWTHVTSLVNLAGSAWNPKTSGTHLCRSMFLSIPLYIGLFFSLLRQDSLCRQNQTRLQVILRAAKSKWPERDSSKLC